jgi:hypothetical protein
MSALPHVARDRTAAACAQTSTNRRDLPANDGPPRRDTGETIRDTAFCDSRAVASEVPWTAVVTAWEGPDALHPMLIRLTLDRDGATETKVYASITEASRQLELWLEQRMTGY